MERKIVRQLIALAERHGARPGVDIIERVLVRAFDSGDPLARQIIAAVAPLYVAEGGIKKIAQLTKETHLEWDRRRATLH